MSGISGLKKKVKDVEKPMFEIDPVTKKRKILPIDWEAMSRALNEDEHQPPKRKSQANVPSFRGSKKETKRTDSPCKLFEIDPATGKKILCRLDFDAMSRALNGESKQQDVKQINGEKKRIVTNQSQRPSRMFDEPKQQTVKPIYSAKKRIFTDLPQESSKGFDIEERPAKIRKMVTPNLVKKGLFSPKWTQNSKTKSSPSRRQNMPKKEPNTVSPRFSPLINMDDFEDEFINRKGVLKEPLFRSPTKFTGLKNSTSKLLNIPAIILEEYEENGNSIQTMNVNNEPKTPDSTEEFRKLEKMCLQRDLESPITSISNLMQGTGINSSIKRTKLNFNRNPEIKTAINQVTQLIKDEQTRHEQNMLKLNSLLTSLTNLIGDETEENKENDLEKGNRRSERLQNKSPLRNSTSKVFTSPAFSRSGDLRKSTLKKNLVAKHLDYQSPRTKKAMELYNSIRSTNPVLETPKSDRKSLHETSNNSSMKISQKLHNQCVLLQDTPIHK